MLDRIKSLELEAKKLEPGYADRAQLIDQVTAYSQTFLEALPEKKSYKPETDKWVDSLLPEGPLPINDILEWIGNSIDQSGINTTSGRHFGYIPGGGIFPSALGDYIAAISNRYSGIYFASPGAVQLEQDLINWMCGLVGYDQILSSGTLTSGGSIANLIAIVNARDAAGLKSEGFNQAVIYCTQQTHHCIPKALKIAGMSASSIRIVPMEDFKMQPDALEQSVKDDRQNGLIPWMIVGSAGTTDTGAIDPLDALGKIAQRHGLWFHVDAAYGGAFLIMEKGKELMQGIEQADSVIIDPHKGFFIPYGSGAVMVKDKHKLVNSFSERANYMQDALSSSETNSPADLSPELSRPFRGLRLWLPLKLFGLGPFQAALEEKILLCQYFHLKIEKWERVEVGPYPELSVTIFRCLPTNNEPNQFNERLVKNIQNHGRIFLSSTTIDGDFYIRMAVVSFRSHLYEVDLALNEIKEQILHLESS